MKILALETSAKSASVAVTEDDALLAYAYQCSGLTHSRTLMPMVQALLENAEMRLEDLDGFAVAAGPGSFTGLRIGIAAVKGLSFATGKPCCGVSTLEAMAQNMRHLPGTLVCAMDARRQQVYNALFSSDGETLQRLTPDRPIALEDLAADLVADPREKTLLGDGAVLCQRFLQEQGIACRLAPPHLRMQSAYGVARLARLGPWTDAQQLQPVYLRLSQAERERLERLSSASSEIPKNIHTDKGASL